MFTFLFLLSLFSIGNSYVFYIEDTCNYDSIDMCLSNFLCSWCNVSEYKNNIEYFTESCIYNENICSSNFTESSMCIYQNSYDKLCNFYDTLMLFVLLFVLTTSTYVITYSLINNFSIESQTRVGGFALVILLLINVPAFILWSTYSHYFGFYLLCLILISFIACCTNNTKRYIHYRKTNKEGYTQINN